MTWSSSGVPFCQLSKASKRGAESAIRSVSVKPKVCSYPLLDGLTNLLHRLLNRLLYIEI